MIVFQRNPVQVSEKTGKPYTKNVRYDEVGSNLWGMVFLPKALLLSETGEEQPDTIQLTIVAGAA